MLNMECSVDEYKFISNLKVLPLGHFDMILGMDWLESFSPMQVHWKHKWMVIPYQGVTAVFQGISPINLNEVIVHVCSIVPSTPDHEGTTVTPEVEVILE